jgi:hypothetical protein
LPRPVLAQESRREQIAQQQAEKARQAHLYVETTGEKIADGVESFLAGVPKGFYPWVGSILGDASPSRTPDISGVEAGVAAKADGSEGWPPVE